MKKPTEERIETLLSSVQPRPSQRLDAKLKDAPWNTHNAKPKTLNFRRWAVAAAFVLVSSALFISPLGVEARAWLAQFFMPQPDSQQAMTLDVMPTPTMPPEQFQATLTAYYDDDFAQSQHETAFMLRQPAFLPEGYTLRHIDVSDDGDFAMLSYDFRAPNPLGRHFVIRQMADPHAHHVGTDAEIRTVRIGEAVGEYVQGDWEALNQSVTAEADGERTIEYQQVWNNNIELHQLFWEYAGVRYEIMFQAAYQPHPAYYDGGAPDQPGYLTLNDLIQIAESIEAE